jgi:hypothetical protein
MKAEDMDMKVEKMEDAEMGEDDEEALLDESAVAEKYFNKEEEEHQE